MVKDIEIDITNRERVFIKTKSLGEISIKETPEGIRIATDSDVIAIIPNGNNSIILRNGN